MGEKQERVPILWIRGEAVILDSDLAALYGVKTGRLNEQIKRNHNPKILENGGTVLPHTPQTTNQKLIRALIHDISRKKEAIV